MSRRSTLKKKEFALPLYVGDIWPISNLDPTRSPARCLLDITVRMPGKSPGGTNLGDSVARQPRLTIAERSPGLRSLAAATVAATSPCATYSSVAFIKWAACPHAIEALVPSFGNFKEFIFQATAWPSYAGIAVYSPLISGFIHWEDARSDHYKAQGLPSKPRGLIDDEVFEIQGCTREILACCSGKDIRSEVKIKSIPPRRHWISLHQRAGGEGVRVHVQRMLERNGLCYLSWLTASMPATTPREHSYHTLECTPRGIAPP
ncbi:hypothetical protein F4809DRAFT_4602 [Biscogniauxia mediterranea]|nr:hypothetical protein F4809DRAFT_4602 [Biscogniauxia mediterranea]